jgi:hypothetical protein
LPHHLTDRREIDEALSWLSRYWNRPAEPAFYDAKTVEEAVSLLEGYRGEAKILAGGIDLLGLMKNEVSSPAVLVNIKNIPSMDTIEENSEGLKIGPLPGSTMSSDLLSSVKRSLFCTKSPIPSDHPRSGTWPPWGGISVRKCGVGTFEGRRAREFRLSAGEKKKANPVTR